LLHIFSGVTAPMPKYLVTADDNPHGTIYLGTHNASNPDNAVQRAREDYEPENMAQELAVSKDDKFQVFKVSETHTVKT